MNGPRYRHSPSHVPCKSSRPGSRRLYAGHHLANKRVTRQACPGENVGPLVLAPSTYFDASTTTPDRTCPAERFWHVFLVPT